MQLLWLVMLAVCLPACSHAKPLGPTVDDVDVEHGIAPKADKLPGATVDDDETPVLFIKGIGPIPVKVLDGPLPTPATDVKVTTEGLPAQSTDSAPEPQIPATEKSTPVPTTEKVVTTVAPASSGRGRQSGGSAKNNVARRNKDTTTTTEAPTTAASGFRGRNRKQSPVAAASSPARSFSPTPKSAVATTTSTTQATKVAEKSSGGSRPSADGLSQFLTARRRQRIESTTEADPIAPILAKAKANTENAAATRGGSRRTTTRKNEATTTTTTEAMEPAPENKNGRNRFSVPKTTTKNGRSAASTTSKPAAVQQPTAGESSSKPRLLPKKPLVFKPAGPSPLLRKSAQTTTEPPMNALDDLEGNHPETLDESAVVEQEAPAPITPAPKPTRGGARGGLRLGSRA